MSKTTTETGIDIIAAERQRHTDAENWTPEHDDQHIQGELATAAACYALPDERRSVYVWSKPLIEYLWPWEWCWWKPAKRKTVKQRIRELAKAGALCAAEIDRLKRRKSP